MRAYKKLSERKSLCAVGCVLFYWQSKVLWCVWDEAKVDLGSTSCSRAGSLKRIREPSVKKISENNPCVASILAYTPTYEQRTRQTKPQPRTRARHERRGGQRPDGHARRRLIRGAVRGARILPGVSNRRANLTLARYLLVAPYASR